MPAAAQKPTLLKIVLTPDSDVTRTRIYVILACIMHTANHKNVILFSTKDVVSCAIK